MELETFIGMNLYLSMHQLVKLWFAFPEDLMLRVELVMRLFSRIIDVENWHILLDRINDYER